MKHWRKPRTSRSINLCRGRENKGRLCGDRRTEQRRPSWSCAEVAITDMLLGAALSRRREVTEAFLYTGNSRKNKEIERRTKKKPTLCTLDRNKERQRKKNGECIRNRRARAASGYKDSVHATSSFWCYGMRSTVFSLSNSLDSLYVFFPANRIGRRQWRVKRNRPQRPICSQSGVKRIANRSAKVKKCCRPNKANLPRIHEM